MSSQAQRPVWAAQEPSAVLHLRVSSLPLAARGLLQTLWALAQWDRRVPGFFRQARISLAPICNCTTEEFEAAIAPLEKAGLVVIDAERHLVYVRWIAEQACVGFSVPQAVAWRRALDEFRALGSPLVEMLEKDLATTLRRAGKLAMLASFYLGRKVDDAEASEVISAVEGPSEAPMQPQLSFDFTAVQPKPATSVPTQPTIAAPPAAKSIPITASDDDPVLAWERLVSSAGPALGLTRRHLTSTGLEHMAERLWAQAWQSLRAAEPPVTLREVDRLGQFIAAGGLRWAGSPPWKMLTRDTAQLQAQLDRSAAWDGNPIPVETRSNRPPNPEAERPRAYRTAEPEVASLSEHLARLRPPEVELDAETIAFARAHGLPLELERCAS